MYAIIRTGGKQVKVSKGDIVRVERLDGEKGAKVTLGDVLLVGDGDKVTVGTPLVAGASVAATVEEQIRDKKVIVFKKKRRQNYRRKQGHRQSLTVLKITDISTGGKSASAKEAAPAKAEAKSAEKPAAKKAADKK